jgi:hypothetical protein
VWGAVFAKEPLIRSSKRPLREGTASDASFPTILIVFPFLIWPLGRLTHRIVRREPNYRSALANSASPPRTSHEDLLAVMLIAALVKGVTHLFLDGIVVAAIIPSVACVYVLVAGFIRLRRGRKDVLLVILLATLFLGVILLQLVDYNFSRR